MLRRQSGLKIGSRFGIKDVIGADIDVHICIGNGASIRVNISDRCSVFGSVLGFALVSGQGQEKGWILVWTRLCSGEAHTYYSDLL